MMKIKKNKSATNKVNLKFKLPVFYSAEEEKLFQQSLKRIKVIEKFEIKNGYIEIIIKSKYIHFIHFQNLVGIALRYNLDNKDQFLIFIDIMTKKPFDSDMWENIDKNKENGFSEKNKSEEIILKPLNFFSDEDENYFFDWLYSIDSVFRTKKISNYLDVVILKKDFTKNDYDNLNAIFKRYNFENISQLNSLNS